MKRVQASPVPGFVILLLDGQVTALAPDAAVALGERLVAAAKEATR